MGTWGLMYSSDYLYMFDIFCDKNDSKKSKLCYVRLGPGQNFVEN